MAKLPCVSFLLSCGSVQSQAIIKMNTWATMFAHYGWNPARYPGLLAPDGSPHLRPVRVAADQARRLWRSPRILHGIPEPGAVSRRRHRFRIRAGQLLLFPAWHAASDAVLEPHRAGQTGVGVAGRGLGCRHRPAARLANVCPLARGGALRGGQAPVLVPPGFAHGFVVFSGTARLYYKCTAGYAKDHERSFRWNNPQGGIRWPIDNPILSPRDAAAPHACRTVPPSRSSAAASRETRVVRGAAASPRLARLPCPRRVA